jgi:hypothetical protein
MTTDHSIPPLRELPTGRLALRKDHLLTEINRACKARLSLPVFTFPRPRVLALAVAGAACAAAVAFAAGGGWLFSSHGQQIVGITHVALQGKPWRVTLKQEARRDGTSLLVVYASRGKMESTRAGGVFPSARSFGEPFAALEVYVPGGQIWAGTTRSTIRRISITYYSGRVYTTDTIAAPRRAKTPYRYWALAVPGVAPAASLTTQDVNGKAILWGLRLNHA